jgi:hypothetical protein
MYQAVSSDGAAQHSCIAIECRDGSAALQAPHPQLWSQDAETASCQSGVTATASTPAE